MDDRLEARLIAVPPAGDQSPAGGTVILLHGFAGFRVMNRPLARRLRRCGYRTVEMGYDSWGLPLQRIVERLAPDLARIDRSCEGPLHFVAHSMGGLVARALIYRQRPASLGRLVMLGTPNGGSELADFLDRRTLLRPILGRAAPALVTRRPASIDALLGPVDFEIGIIAGDRPIVSPRIASLVPAPSDGKVSVASTRLEGAAGHIVLPLPHSLLPYHASAHRQILSFLANGCFLPLD